MRVVADRNRCAGNGQCVLTDAAIFDQDEEEGRVVVLNERPGAESAERVRQAVRLCPVRALAIEE
ncbi:ferredoxin [Nocardiopsis gilva YIM 90087]|uniref:Ferredoxin n=1 Tax=Nocardiopsis gilva YIM 90087 TaxID=1235441 RepID=A0A223SBP4_9ACTN|nr:ferredoxin [Nocardiopsis gilva]ASU85584.1 ferredoxin [Nocardiopsis gilva YIM 90087]